MAKHRAQALFDRARWRLVMLLPAWLAQGCLALALLGAHSWKLAETVRGYDDYGDQGTIRVVWTSTNVALSLVVAAATVVEVVKYRAESLTPTVMLSMHVVKLASALILLALDLVAAVRVGDSDSILSLGLTGALTLVTTSTVVYSALVYRRVSSHGDYVRPVNYRSYGYRDADHHRHRSRSVTNDRLSTASILEKGRLSVSSLRRASISSAEHERGSYSPPTEMQVIPRERRPSYSHQRDTSFDDYRARRSSVGREADSGGVSRGSSRSQSPDAGRITVGRVAVTRPAEVNRSVSERSDHVLVAVPEEEMEHDHRALLGRGRPQGSFGSGSPVVRQSVDIGEPRWMGNRRGSP